MTGAVECRCKLGFERDANNALLLEEDFVSSFNFFFKEEEEGLGFGYRIADVVVVSCSSNGINFIGPGPVTGGGVLVRSSIIRLSCLVCCCCAAEVVSFFPPHND